MEQNHLCVMHTVKIKNNSDTIQNSVIDWIDMSNFKLHKISVSQTNPLKSRNLFSWQSMKQTCIIDEVHGFNTQVLHWNKIQHLQLQGYMFKFTTASFHSAPNTLNYTWDFSFKLRYILVHYTTSSCCFCRWPVSK